MNLVARIGAACLILLVSTVNLPAQVPGWDANWPSPQKVFAGCDPETLRLFNEQSAAIQKNPRDEDALVNRGVYGLRLARSSRYDLYLLWLAAKDLEAAIKLDPNDFAAWHNYGDVNYSAGDAWMQNDHSNARRAVDAFTHAIRLNPKSARSYMGRGWAYYSMNDAKSANADFQKALQLDPSLRPDMEKEIANIQKRHGEESAARGTIQKMSEYYVDKTATTYNACTRARCLWTGSECRCSMALNPGR